MQRLLATIVFLCFAAGPGLNLPCLVRCAPMSATETPENSCHHPADSDLKLTSAADCAEHQAVQPPALLVSRTDAASARFVGTVLDTLPVPRQTLSVLSGIPSLLTTGPPPSFSPTPLRI